jgi:hypothetical protein
VRLAEFLGRLSSVEGASGVAVALDPQVVVVDVFERPSTCRKVWERLLRVFRGEFIGFAIWFN